MNRKPQNATPRFLTLLVFVFFTFNATAQEQKSTVPHSNPDTIHIVSAQKINATTVEVQLSNRQHMLLDFYGDNINLNSPNLDINIKVHNRQLNLTEQQKSDIIEFLNALTDMTFVNNPAYKSPF